MKPFKFSLQTLYNHTADRENEQKKKLTAIDRRLQEKHDEIKAVEMAMANLCRDFQEKMSQGSGSLALQQFNHSFAALREEQLKKQQERAQIEQEKKDCQQVLIRLMREIQALDKLRDKQYEAYKVEAAREADKEMDEFVSFQQGQALAARGVG